MWDENHASFWMYGLIPFTSLIYLWKESPKLIHSQIGKRVVNSSLPYFGSHQNQWLYMGGTATLNIGKISQFSTASVTYPQINASYPHCGCPDNRFWKIKHPKYSHLWVLFPGSTKTDDIVILIIMADLSTYWTKMRCLWLVSQQKERVFQINYQQIKAGACRSIDCLPSFL